MTNNLFVKGAVDLEIKDIGGNVRFQGSYHYLNPPKGDSNMSIFDNSWFIKSILSDYYSAVKKVENDVLATEKVKKLYTRAIQLQCSVDFGHVMTLADFINAVADGYFIDYDGHGKFLTDDGNKKEYVKCDVEYLKMYENTYNYIIWYNK